ncbi:MAG TPA: tetratricopeptide repeat-containing serine protease family protein [Rhizomicrobium sp.]|nr:tetratricopeptide repeat-containing serine protease family protein [Rhizomicrobium sp.]
MKHRLFAKLLVLSALVAVPAAAGPREDGDAAYQKQDFKTAAQNYMVAASQGDDTARARLGMMFAYGIGVPMDGAQAVFWLSLSAEHNNPEADTMMGRLLMEGRFLPKDLDKAMQFFSRAADQGVAPAQTALGELYLKGTPSHKSDLPAAMHQFELAAYQNDPKAEYDLGFMYYTGMGTKQDYIASSGWFGKAANQGDAGAAAFLGTQFDKGLGVAEDAYRAVYYFGIAALQGNLMGLGLLGEKYLSGGGGLAQDYARAYLLLNIAASQAGYTFHDQAVKGRDAAKAKLSPTELDAAQALAAFCTTGNNGYALCIDDVTPVAVAAADPPAAFARMQARLKANQRQQPSQVASNAASSPGKPQMVGNGTGFYVSGAGDIVTAAHVVTGCDGELRSPLGVLKVVADDAQSDVALLTAGRKSPAFIRLRGGRGARVGEAVVAIGYPLQGILGQDQIVTTGTLSSLAGLQNDRRNIQISAPVQPGNSGGPIVGEDGALVGVLVSSISTMKMAESIGGAIPQNTNFAVSIGTLQAFLNAHQVPYVLSDGQGTKKSSADIAAEAARYTMIIECWK